MNITMLGTGNALVTKCYNTCFVLTDPDRPKEDSHLLVDGGGGNGVLRQLELAGIDIADIHSVFVTHCHIDHLLGIVWVIRMVAQGMNAGTYEGDLVVYSHDEVIDLLWDLTRKLLAPVQSRLVGRRIHLLQVSDGQQVEVIGHKMTFFDIESSKAKQFGFRMELDSEGYLRPRYLVCCGDETFAERDRQYAEGATVLMHDAFCLTEDAGRLHPHEKHHSTVEDAATIAESLEAGSLLLYHTEDGDLANRRRRYALEAEQYFGGMVYVPEDLETIEV